MIREGFKNSLAVSAGYLVVGIAFGLSAYENQISWFWAVAMSVFVYAGSLQFAGIGMISQGAGAAQVLLMSLAVNIRHIVYGVSFLREFAEKGFRRLYLIFGLTDETYGLLCQKKAENRTDAQLFFWISLFDQLWWILGTLLGSAAGLIVPISTEGIDFAMTALFFVTCLDQLKSGCSVIPLLIGLVCSVVSLILFGSQGMIVPSLLMILVFLAAGRKKIMKEKVYE